MNELGEKIKTLRKERGFTQANLANILGFSATQIHNWEIGKYKPKTPELYRLEAILNAPLIEIGEYPEDGTFAEKLLYLRISNGIGKTQLAEILGVANPCMTRWERGDAIPSRRMKVRIEKYFNVDLSAHYSAPKGKNRMSDFDTPLGKKITEIRTKMGLSQKKFGQLIGADDSTVSAWETGKNSISDYYLNKLYAIYAITPEMLFGDEIKENPLKPWASTFQKEVKSALTLAEKELKEPIYLEALDSFDDACKKVA